jgi:UDP-GlcNAc:undecaprenyl-phosphate GlcNAc-1-phosphate transferase
MYSILFLAISSFLICLILTPLVRTWFHRQGVLDHPDEGRKLHSSPIPRVGGIAIALSYLAALALLLLSPLNGAGSVNLPFVWDLMPAAMVIFATGLLDDLVGLSPWQKIFGQLSAAGLAYWAGVRILGVGGFSAHGWWSIPLTVLWLVGCANAFNLIDGVDGLAAGVGLFATLTIFLAALLQNNAPLALATVPLAGALLAFLRYNFNPASIFLGDCGSLSIGFLLGCYGVIWSQKSATVLGMTAPLMALSIPLLDTMISVVRRFLRHQPIFGADRNHIHHRLLDRGFSPRRVALLFYGVCGITAAFSLLQSMPQNRFGGLIIIVFCAATWIGVQHLGYAEFDTARRLVLKGTFRHILHTQVYMATFERKLAAAVTAEECWQVIREASRDFGFAHVRMQLAGEHYEERLDDTTPGRSCTMRIPLSDSEHVNLTRDSEVSVRHMVAMISLVHVLQRVLGSRVQQFSAMDHLQSSNGHDAKSLVASH